jgi:hypothetical protein
MKSKVLCISILLFAVISSNSQNALLKNELIVETRVPLEKITWFKDTSNIYDKYLSSRIYENIIVNEFDLGNEILEKIKTDKLAVYDNLCDEIDKKKCNQINYDFPYSLLDYQKISKEDALINFGQRSCLFIKEVGDEWVEFDTTYEPDPKSVKELIFYETWDFDESKFEFNKKVIAYNPIRIFYKEGDVDIETTLSSRLFFLINKNYADEEITKQDEKNMILWQKVKYEFDFENYEFTPLNSISEFAVNMDYIELNNSPFFSYYSRNKLRNLIVDRALSGKYNIYDFEGNQIDTCTAKSKLGYEIEISEIELGDGSEKNIFIETPVNISNITSVIFYEYWYINPETLNFKKEVVGIAPVYKYYEYGDWNLLNPKKRVAFVIYFDESKKF